MDDEQLQTPDDATVTVEESSAARRVPTVERMAARVRREIHPLGIHSSGRFDRADAAWVKSNQRLARSHGGATWFLTNTETERREAAVIRRCFRPIGWSWAHLTSSMSVDGLVMAWQPNRMRLVDAKSHKLSDMTYRRTPAYGGGMAALQHTLVCHHEVLVGDRQWEDQFTLVVHLPTDETELRQHIWLDCLEGDTGLVALVDDLHGRHPHAQFSVVGDYNKNWRQPEERRMVQHHLQAHLPRLLGKASWDTGVPKTGGTHGPRGIIDWAVGSASGGGLEPDDASSDHRPFHYRRHIARSAA